MPAPTTQLARTRPDIADSMVEFDLQANESKMISMEVFPVFEIAEQAGNFGRIPIEALLEESDTSRASGASYGRGDYEFEDAFFATKENGWEEPVDDRDKRIYKDYFDAEKIAAMRARSKVMINQEKRAANHVFGGGVTNSDAASVAWGLSATAEIIDDVEAAVLAEWARTGVWPNSLIMSYLLFRKVRKADEILDRISANGAGDKIKATDVTAQQLAEVFDLDNIIVAGASRNTAKKGQAVAVAQIWDPTKACVAKIVTGDDIREPGLGRTFHWAEDGSKIGTLAESYRDETCRSEIHRARHETDERLIYQECGQVITGC